MESQDLSVPRENDWTGQTCCRTKFSETRSSLRRTAAPNPDLRTGDGRKPFTALKASPSVCLSSKRLDSMHSKIHVRFDPTLFPR
jgi:hypothetical protein